MFFYSYLTFFLCMFPLFTCFFWPFFMFSITNFLIFFIFSEIPAALRFKMRFRMMCAERFTTSKFMWKLNSFVIIKENILINVEWHLLIANFIIDKTFDQSSWWWLWKMRKWRFISWFAISNCLFMSKWKIFKNLKMTFSFLHKIFYKIKINWKFRSKTMIENKLCNF